jgi:hypothetical protein
MDGFSIVGSAGTIEGDTTRPVYTAPRPVVVGLSTSPSADRYSGSDDKIRMAACAAVRAYKGRDEFVRRIKKAHAGQRNWTPNLRTAQALLSIIDGLKANGVAVS